MGHSCLLLTMSRKVRRYDCGSYTVSPIDPLKQYLVLDSFSNEKFIASLCDGKHVSFIDFDDNQLMFVRLVFNFSAKIHLT